MKTSPSSRYENINPTAKYLAFGLIIGLCIASLLLSGIGFAALQVIAPSPTETASLVPSTTPSPTTTWTPLPSPTSTITPTATPDSIQSKINTGQIFFFGPLSIQQQTSLYEASLGYIAPTTQQSIFLSKLINGLKYGNPSNTCGPLAIAIMRDAGLVSANVNPHDFWLLNPNIQSGRDILNRVFPPSQYDDYRFKTPINKFAWSTFYLQPGDFLYIYHGTGGNFDHMLVVNRVDDHLRAYAVTNFNTPNGFIMDEVMLYDPADPAAGIFHTWTETQLAVLGSTGFGGFEVWRLRNP